MLHDIALCLTNMKGDPPCFYRTVVFQAPLCHFYVMCSSECNSTNVQDLHVRLPFDSTSICFCRTFRRYRKKRARNIKCLKKCDEREKTHSQDGLGNPEDSRPEPKELTTNIQTYSMSFLAASIKPGQVNKDSALKAVATLRSFIRLTLLGCSQIVLPL